MPVRRTTAHVPSDPCATQPRRARPRCYVFSRTLSILATYLRHVNMTQRLCEAVSSEQSSELRPLLIRFRADRRISTGRQSCPAFSDTKPGCPSLINNVKLQKIQGETACPTALSTWISLLPIRQGRVVPLGT